jgi:hypothetical protein
VIKQFNFYDIYGYLIPGMLLLGVLWVPIGLTMKTVPEQDLSKALFLAVLAYVIGHLLRTVSSALVPSTLDGRVISDQLLDKSDRRWTKEFKELLEKQVKPFGLPLNVDRDGTGSDETSENRKAAFFQARAYLIAKKAAAYAEQFEGLYSMMRGLGCSLCAGIAYFLGWLAPSWAPLSWVIWVLTAVGVVGTFKFSMPTKVKREAKKSDEKKKHEMNTVAALWLFCFLGFGHAVGTASASHFGHPLYPNSQRLLFAGVVGMSLAAIKCFAAYRYFAEQFAQTVWRDFSACVSYGSTPETGQPVKP